MNEIVSILILLSGFPKAIDIHGLLDAIGLDAVEEIVANKKIDPSLLIATWTQLFFLLLILYPLRHCRAACQAEILCAASGTDMAGIAQMKKIVPFITCDTSLIQQVCKLLFGVNVTD